MLPAHHHLSVVDQVEAEQKRSQTAVNQRHYRHLQTKMTSTTTTTTTTTIIVLFIMGERKQIYKE